MGRPSKLNIAQQNRIINLYVKDKLSTNKISKMFGVATATINNILTRHNIQLRSGSETNKLSTKFTFTTMNEEKSFLLGLIYGDGSISKRNDYINITSGDLDLLEKSKLILGDKFKIRKVADQNCHRGIINSHKLCEELFLLFKLTNNKSDKLAFPNLEPQLYPSFISGYLATDGCININKKDNLIVLSFYSCSKQFLEDLNVFLCDKTQQKYRTIYERKTIKGHLGKKPLYTLVFNGAKAEKALEYIFSDKDKSIRCDRKYNIYEKFIQTKINKLSTRINSDSE